MSTADRAPSPSSPRITDESTTSASIKPTHGRQATYFKYLKPGWIKIVCKNKSVDQLLVKLTMVGL